MYKWEEEISYGGGDREGGGECEGIWIKCKKSYVKTRKNLNVKINSKRKKESKFIIR